MALKPRKIIFLQTIQEECAEKDRMRNPPYFNLDETIAGIKREITDLYKTSKKLTLCPEEKEEIQKYIKKRISDLMDKKTELIELRIELYGTG